jgi:hypothetical protein
MPLLDERLLESRHRPKALGPGAGKEQCLGEMPWISRATAIEPDAKQFIQNKIGVKRRAARVREGDHFEHPNAFLSPSRSRNIDSLPVVFIICRTRGYLLRA